MCLCMHVYTFVYVCVCVFVYVYVYVCICVCVIFASNIILCLQKWQVMADLNDLSDEIQDVLKNHLSMFNISSPSDVAKIDEHVK